MTGPLPDWHHPLRTAAGTAWAAHDEPGVAFVAPAALAAGADGFHLDLVGQDLAVAGAGGHARVVAFWRQRLDAVPDEPLRTHLVRDGYRTVLPLPVVSGTLRLRPTEALGTAPLDVPLDPRGVDGLHVGTRLDAVAADLLLAALRRGAALLTAQALLRVEGVAARHPARLTVDVARFRTGVAALAGDGPGVDEPTLRSTLRDDPGRLGVTATPPPTDDETALTCADAVADRLLARLLVPVLSDDGTVRLQPADASGLDRLEEDLGATVVVPHTLAPATDPWGPLAHASAADVERAVHRHTAPAFDSGRRTLAVTTVVQPPWAGVAALAVDLVVPAAPPDRPRTLRETVLLAGADLATVELALAPGEPLTGSAQVLAVFDGTVTQAVGPQVPLVDDVLVLTADAVPATLLPVGIDPALAGLAAHVDVAWAGSAGGATTRQHVRLAAGAEHATLLVPADATDGTLTATAHHADGRTAATAPQPAGPLALDPFAFPGTGHQEVVLAATVTPGAPALVVELLADPPADPADRTATPERVVLTPDRPTATWSWFSGSPFHAFGWRLAGTTDTWHPGTAGVLDLTTTPAGSPGMSTPPHAADGTRPLEVGVDGLVAHRDGDHWRVTPTGGGLAHDATGQPALTLVTAGPMTFLSLTAELPQPPAAVAALTDAITRLTGETQPRLVPADLGSGATELVLDGTTIARGTTSGSGPHSTALAATLTAEQTDTVRAALEGARERLVVRFTLPGGSGGSGTSQSSSTTAGTTTSTVTTSTTSSSGEGPPVTTTDSTTTHVTSGSAREDAPPPPPTDLHLSTDAADWRVPA